MKYSVEQRPCRPRHLMLERGLPAHEELLGWGKRNMGEEGGDRGLGSGRREEREGGGGEEGR